MEEWIFTVKLVCGTYLFVLEGEGENDKEGRGGEGGGEGRGVEGEGRERGGEGRGRERGGEGEGRGRERGTQQGTVKTANAQTGHPTLGEHVFHCTLHPSPVDTLSGYHGSRDRQILSCMYNTCLSLATPTAPLYVCGGGLWWEVDKASWLSVLLPSSLSQSLSISLNLSLPPLSFPLPLPPSLQFPQSLTPVSPSFLLPATPKARSAV